MDGWDTQDLPEIIVGARRMRVGRRRSTRGRKPRRVALVLVVLLVLAGGVVWLLQWIGGGDDVPADAGPAVVAPGGFRADTGADHTITVGLEVENRSGGPLTLVDARIVAPAGLTSTALAIIPAGPNNEGFALDGKLPAPAPVDLGTSDTDRTAIIAARFTVDCAGLMATDAALDEQIFVMVKIGDEQHEEELTPPVVGDVPWLAATAQRVCENPRSDESAEPPLPPDGDAAG